MLFVSLWCCARVATATTYVFTRIADSGVGQFHDASFGAPLINNPGQILFAATDSTGVTTWYRADGATFTPIAADGGPISSFVGQASLNNLGMVLCTVQRSDGQIAALVGSGGTLSTLYDSLNTDFVQRADEINDEGQIVFFGSVAGVPGAYRGDGGPPTRITLSANAMAGSINNGGQVAYMDSTLIPMPVAGVFRGSGSAITTIADNTGMFATFSGFPLVNAAGQVAFRAGFDGGGAAVLVGDGTSLTTIADTSGAYHSFAALGFSDSGQIALQASLDSPSVGYGIYTGGDPVSDLVIAFGDVLDGSTVDDLSIGRQCVNDSGQIVFMATLSDLRVGIYLATPTTTGCTGPHDGDMNGDLATNGRDVAWFIQAVLAGSTELNAVCPADFNNDGVCDVPDIAPFISTLLAQ